MRTPEGMSSSGGLVTTGGGAVVGNADVEADKGGLDFGNCGSVGVGKVDVEDMGVATASSSAAVELPELTVRLNSRLL
jgi:hypothetical protein